VFDGTTSLSAPILTFADNITVLSNASVTYAVAFRFLATNSPCGAGVFPLTQLVLAVSRVAVNNDPAGRHYVY